MRTPSRGEGSPETHRPVPSRTRSTRHVGKDTRHSGCSAEPCAGIAYLPHPSPDRQRTHTSIHRQVSNLGWCLPPLLSSQITPTRRGYAATAVWRWAAVDVHESPYSPIHACRGQDSWARAEGAAGGWDELLSQGMGGGSWAGNTRGQQCSHTICRTGLAYPRYGYGLLSTINRGRRTSLNGRHSPLSLGRTPSRPRDIDLSWAIQRR